MATQAKPKPLTGFHEDGLKRRIAKLLKSGLNEYERRMTQLSRQELHELDGEKLAATATQIATGLSRLRGLTKEATIDVDKKGKWQRKETMTKRQLLNPDDVGRKEGVADDQ